MPPEADASAWDFLSLAAWWNLYGLPAVLVITACFAAILRDRVWRGAAPAPRSPMRTRLNRPCRGLAAVRLIALIHLGLGIAPGSAWCRNC